MTEFGLLSVIRRSAHPPPPPPQSPTEDEDEMFFCRLLPNMQTLSVAKRARVRFRVHQLVFEAEQEHEAELEAGTSAI